VRFTGCRNPEDTEREAGRLVLPEMNADEVTADDHARFEAWLRAPFVQCEGLCRALCHVEGAP